MWSKLYSKEENNIDNHGEHSTSFNTKAVIQTNNEHMFIKTCSVNLGRPIIDERLEIYARKRPDKSTFGQNQKYTKRRKIRNNLESCNSYDGPFNGDYLTRNSDDNLLKPGMFNPKKRDIITSKFLKLNPEIILDCIKLPSVNKFKMLINLMHTDSIYFIYTRYLKDFLNRGQKRQMDTELKTFLFNLCYKKICEFREHKKMPTKIKPNILCSSKLGKQILHRVFKRIRPKLTISDMSLRKLILYNGGLTGYPKKPLLVICINAIYKFFMTINWMYFRHLRLEYLKKFNCISYKQMQNPVNKIQSIKLYREGTTKRKDFLEIIDEYKVITNTERLSLTQVSDIRHAYEGILEPGQYIDQADLEKCANENYNFKRLNHTIISKDLNTTNNDDFDFDDIDRTPVSVLQILYKVPTDTDCSSTPKIENIDKADKFPEHLLEWVKEVQSRNYFILKADTNKLETTEDNSKNVSIETVEKEVSIQCTSNEDHDIENENPKHSEEVKMSMDGLEIKTIAIINQNTFSKDISSNDFERTTVANYSEAETSSGNLEKQTATNTLQVKCNSSYNYSKITEEFKKNVLSHSIKLSKLEKRTLTIIIFSDINLYKINWKKYSPSTRTRLFQIIVYFGIFKMALSDKLDLDCLRLKNKNVCDMVDFKNLLKSIQVDACVFQKCLTFSEVDNFLIWPLSKIIVNKTISQRNPTINILFSFVKNIITKFCEQVKDFLHKSGLKIVLNKESLFESLSNIQIGKDNLNTELSLKYANARTPLLPVDTDGFSNDVPENSNSEHFYLTNARFRVKKTSSNEEICKSMVDILKSDNSILKSWKECNNSHSFISQLLKAGITLPIEENNTGHGSKFVEVYVKWFCEEYLQGDKLCKLAVNIFKNIVHYIDTSSGCTDIKVETAINNALIILYKHPCAAKAYESYLKSKKPKYLSSSCSKYDNNSGSKSHSDLEGVSIRSIEEVKCEPNINIQTEPIDTSNVGISLINTNVPISNVFEGLNSVQFNNSVTSDPQCSNYNFIHDFTKLISENDEATSNNLFENNLFHSCDNDLLNNDNSDCNHLLFNEASPFDDMSIDNPYDVIMPLETRVNDMLEINLQFQPAKNTEEVSLISSCDELVHYAVSDEISLEDLNMAVVDDQYGFDNAGVLLPPYN